MKTPMMEDFFNDMERSLSHFPEVRFKGYWTSWSNSYISSDRKGMMIFLNYLEDSECGWSLYEDKGGEVLLYDPNLDLWRVESYCCGYLHKMEFIKLQEDRLW